MDAIPGTLPGKNAALAARYGDDAAPAAGPWNETIAQLLQHRSVRAYLPTALPTGTLETLVAAAQSAATSSNLQTWSVVSVTDPAVRAKLAAIAGGQKHIEQCPLYLVWLADLSRLARIAEAEGRVLEGLPFLEPFLVASIDAALAAQNAVVAAESLGLSTLYIGAMRNDVVAVAELLGLPPGVAGVFGLCVGYADPAAPSEVKPRLPQDGVLHHGTYRIGDEVARRAAYDERMGAFSRRNEMQADTWTERVLSRIASVKALRGRDRLKAALRRIGFPLQ
ncbi:nitroreductase [Stella humosa]|uniref:Nitroreductase n=1 Tax=Stella humosa TaxID=94 RepID=A0A3N1MC86_9PROT|nr:NADPH-dependent oxidoreductase [Stella humosa]ROQ01208.1 nitroreductase [Stella humosa]BBK31582.1 NADPH-dependent oxidoreductase [Stella humosa]